MSSECSSSEGEWEDVEPLEGVPAADQEISGGPSSAQPPLAGSLEIVLQNKSQGKGKSVNHVEKALAAFYRELYRNLHKVNLLCLVSRGMYLSRQCDDVTMRSCLLSVLEAEKKQLLYRDIEMYNKDSVLKLLDWFSKTSQAIEEKVNEETGVQKNPSMIQLLVTIIRAIGLRARLVMVLNPISFRPPSPSSSAGTQPGEEQTTPKKQKSSLNAEQKAGSSVGRGGDDTCVKSDSIATEETPAVVESGVETTKKSSRKRKGSLQTPPAAKSVKTSSSRRHSTVSSKHSPYFEKEQTGRKKRVKGSEPQSGDSDTEYKPDSEILKSNDDTVVSSEDEDIVQPKRKKRRYSKTSSPAKKLKQAAEQSTKLTKKSKRDSITKHKAIVSEETTSKDVELHGVEDTSSWAEVYLPGTAAPGDDKKHWYSVNPLSFSVGQPQLCEKHCTLPLHYVVAFESGDIVRDVTARYASGWCTSTRKGRISEEWWAETLQPFEPSDLQEKEAEDEDLLSILYAQPLPTVVSDYKNHPLYALRRHLLKFEAIYPKDSQAIGYCKGEPVYARECVHTLHTRETWLKEGRLVRRGEEAYNIVKARTKKGQSVLDAQSNTVEVFGRWQTEEYIAPPVVNGKVPRNEYGNLELFKPSMLPVGAAHIPIQGVQRVAKKLGIDCVPAVTGWEFHGGHCHPVIEGVVVAEECREVLLEAWQQEEQLTIEREIKRREKRVTERWRKLVKGLLVRERVKRTYSMVNSSQN